MASLNKYIALVRLTRDIQYKMTKSGSRMAMLGLAISEKKKNYETGQWEDAPIFIDAVMFNGGPNSSYKPVDAMEKVGPVKGSQLLIEAKLQFDQWDDKQTGQKRSKHKLLIDNWTLVGNKEKQHDDLPPTTQEPDRRPPPPHQQAIVHDDYQMPGDVPF